MTHQYNNIVQTQRGERVDRTAQPISELVTNIQRQRQSNVVIDPTTVASL